MIEIGEMLGDFLAGISVACALIVIMRLLAGRPVTERARTPQKRRMTRTSIEPTNPC